MQWVVRCTPLYNATALVRALMLGGVGWTQLANVAYLAAMGLAGVAITRRRIGKLLLK
jgi:hypothetical protein